MRFRTLTVILLLLLAAIQTMAATGTPSLASETAVAISQTRVWRSEVSVTVTPLTPHLVLARCTEAGKNAKQTGTLWLSELKKLATEQRYSFEITVAPVDPRKPGAFSQVERLLKEPSLLVGANRVPGLVTVPFSRSTSENTASLTAQVSFNRRDPSQSPFSEYIGRNSTRFIIRLTDPDQFFNMSDWIEVEFRIPFQYPDALLKIYKELKGPVSARYLYTF